LPTSQMKLAYYSFGSPLARSCAWNSLQHPEMRGLRSRRCRSKNRPQAALVDHGVTRKIRLPSGMIVTQEAVVDLWDEELQDIDEPEVAPYTGRSGVLHLSSAKVSITRKCGVPGELLDIRAFISKTLRRSFNRREHHVHLHRRRFTGSLSSVAGASALAAQQPGGRLTPEGRMSPLDGVTRAKHQNHGRQARSVLLPPQTGRAVARLGQQNNHLENRIGDRGSIYRCRNQGHRLMQRYSGAGGDEGYVEKVIKPSLIGKDPFDVSTCRRNYGRGAEGLGREPTPLFGTSLGKPGVARCTRSWPPHGAADSPAGLRLRGASSHGRKGSRFPGRRTWSSSLEPQGRRLYRVQVPSGGASRGRQHRGLHSLLAPDEEGGSDRIST